MTETDYTQNRPDTVCTSSMDLSCDEDGNVSPYSCCSDEDNNSAHTSTRQLMDELPVFSTQSLSPSGRSLSPIDIDFPSPPRSSHGNSVYGTPFDSPSQMVQDARDFVTLEEIQARIGMTPPADQDPERCRSPWLNLETIFEDQFLETPPKNGKEPRPNRDLLRRSFRNRPPVLGAAAMVTVAKDADCSVSAVESLGQQFGTKFKVGLD